MSINLRNIRLCRGICDGIETQSLNNTSNVFFSFFYIIVGENAGHHTRVKMPMPKIPEPIQVLKNLNTFIHKSFF